MTTEVEPLSWGAVEEALKVWLVDTLGLVDDFQIEEQDLQQPPFPYASAKLVAIAKEGGIDEKRADFDDAREAGSEMRLLSTGPVILTYSVSFHNLVEDQAQALSADETGMARALRAQASLGMLSVLQHFGEYNLAIVKELGVKDTSIVENSNWRSRGTLDIQLRATTQMTEYAGYIDKVELASDDLGIDTVLDSTEE